MTMTNLSEAGRAPMFTLGDRLRKAREEAGYDRQQFAELIGVHRQSVQRYEDGVIPPRPPVITAWAMATGIRRSWLETGEYTPRDLNPEPTGSRKRIRALHYMAADYIGLEQLDEAA